MIYKPVIVAVAAMAIILVQWRFYSFQFFKRHYPFLVKLFVLLLLYAFLSNRLNIFPLFIRYMVLAYIPFWVIIFLIINKLNNRIVINSISVILIILSIGYFSNQKLDNPWGKEYLSIASYIADQEKQGEPIFIYKNFMAMVLDHAYQGENKIHPIPEKVNPKKQFGQINWFIDDYNEVDSVFHHHYSDSFWLIKSKNSFLENKLCIETNDEILDQYVSDNFKIISEKQVGNLQVQRLRWLSRDKRKQAVIRRSEVTPPEKSGHQ